MASDLPDICSAVSAKTGAPIETVHAVVESFLIELHRRVHKEPRPSGDYIGTDLSEEIAPSAYFHLVGMLDYFRSHDFGEAEWSELQRECVPLSEYIIGADLIRRWENRLPEPRTSRIIFLGLPTETVEIELEVECKGEGESCYVENVRERASGFDLGPVDGWDLDLWDDRAIDLIVLSCADLLAKCRAFKPGVFYRLNVCVVADGIWTPSHRSGFLAFRYSEGMTFERAEDDDSNEPRP